MKRLYLFASISIIGFASGCNFFAPPAAEQTLAADYASTATQIVIIRESATALADRLNVTLEHAQTAVRAADAQSTRIAGTLQATGMQFIDTRFITPLFPTPVANDTAQNSSNPQPVFAITPVNSGEGAQGNSALQIQPSPTPIATVTIDPESPRLENTVLAQSVGADDCPTGTTTVFPTNSEGVYVSALAFNIAPNNVIVSRWSREGIEVVSYDWSPGFDIEQGCIWFYMPATDVDFSAGNWSVQLELDGVTVGQPIGFTVTGTADVMDAMSEGG